MKILKIILNKKSYFKYCLFILSFHIMSCEKDFVDTNNSPQQHSSSLQIQNKMLDDITGEAEVNSVKLHENVKVLDETANSQMISYSDDKIEFLSHESVNNIQVGDVLNSAPSTLAKYGILVRVLGKEVENGKIILEVEPGDIDDLFEEADFRYNLQKDVVLKKGANKSEPDFGVDFNFGTEVGALGKRNVDVQMGGRLDFSFDFDLNGLGKSDNYLYSMMNISFDRNINSPDLAINFGSSFEILAIDDLDLFTITVFVGVIAIPITVSVDVGVELEYDFGIAPGSIGWDLHGDFGFEGASKGGVNQYEDKWNTMRVDRKVQMENAIDFSATLKAPLVKFKATPFKRVVGSSFSVYAEASLAVSLGYDRPTGCIIGEPSIGIEGGFTGEFYSLNYELSASAEFTIPDFHTVIACNNVGEPKTYKNVGFKSGTDREYLVFSDNGNSSGSTNDYKSYAHCNRGSFGDWEKFDLIGDADGTFAIRSIVNGKYADVYRTDNYDTYRIRFDSSDKYRDDCRFIIEDHPEGNGYKAIKSVASGRYLSCEGPDDKYVRPNRYAAGSWERWTIINADL